MPTFSSNSFFDFAVLFVIISSNFHALIEAKGSSAGGGRGGGAPSGGGGGGGSAGRSSGGGGTSGGGAAGGGGYKSASGRCVLCGKDLSAFLKPSVACFISSAEKLRLALCNYYYHM